MLSYFLIVKCCLSDLQLAVEFVYCLVLIEVLAKVKYSVYSLSIYNDLDESKITGSSVFLFHALLHRMLI